MSRGRRPIRIFPIPYTSQGRWFCVVVNLLSLVIWIISMGLSDVRDWSTWGMLHDCVIWRITLSSSAWWSQYGAHFRPLTAFTAGLHACVNHELQSIRREIVHCGERVINQTLKMDIWAMNYWNAGTWVASDISSQKDLGFTAPFLLPLASCQATTSQGSLWSFASTHRPNQSLTRSPTHSLPNRNFG